MTEQFAINLLELQFISISNTFKKRWLRLHIKEFKRQKLQVESKQQSDFQIANYLETEIKKKKFSFSKKAMVGDMPKTISGIGKYQYHKLCSCLSYLFASTYEF